MIKKSTLFSSVLNRFVTRISIGSIIFLIKNDQKLSFRKKQGAIPYKAFLIFKTENLGTFCELFSDVLKTFFSKMPKNGAIFLKMKKLKIPFSLDNLCLKEKFKIFQKILKISLFLKKWVLGLTLTRFFAKNRFFSCFLDFQF